MQKLQAIVSDLRNAIRTGKYPEGKRIPSEIELADLYHTSTITLNKALNILVNEGYLHRPGARRNGTFVLAQRPYPQGFIAALSMPLSSSFCARILDGAIRAAEQYRYAIIPCTFPNNSEELRSLLENHRFAGILTTSQERLSAPLPTVYIDVGFRDETLHQVCSNTAEGGRLIAETLLNAGHRNVVYCSLLDMEGNYFARREAFVRTMKENGIRDMEQRIFFCKQSDPVSAKNLLRRVLASFPHVTAIACSNDACALRIIQAGRELGVDVGREITVTGFGNLREIQIMQAFLTVEQFPEESGHMACTSLIHRIEYPDSPYPHLEKLDVRLVHAELIRRIN